MIIRKPRIASLVIAILGLFAIASYAEEPATKIDADRGKQVYQQHCANCHEAENTKAPTLASLKQKPAEFITASLTQGKMQTQGLPLGVYQMSSVVRWLTKDQPAPDNWAESYSCSDKSVNLTTGPAIGDWGYGAKNHRYQSPESGGISSKNVADLTLKWALVFPKATEMRSQPVLIGDTLFIALLDLNKIYAIDADSGCVKWEYTTLTGPRSAIGYGKISGRPTLWFGDMAANFYALDPLTGKEIWRKNLAIHKQSTITGQAVLNEDILYVPMSLYEIMSAAAPTYPCCQGHGGLIALDGETGEQVWRVDTTEKARKTGLSSNGTQQWGPSGAPVWNSPAIDTKRGLLYFGTGENTSDPATETSDAIFALDLKTGEQKWLFQATKNDTFNAACGRTKGPNCPQIAGPDFDFGASVVIATLPNGKDVLFAGQKSGTVWALDPDNNGSVLWEQNTLSNGSTLGGIHWGIAYDGKRVYVPIADPPGRKNGYSSRPALHALNQETGEVIWTQNITPSCIFDRKQAMVNRAAGKRLDCFPSHGLSAPPTVAGDVVFVGNLEGMYRAYSSETGELLWERNTNTVFKGVNGIDGHGGSIDNNGSVISNGRVFIQSGYSLFRQLPGNVLLQYTVDGN